eukprot:6187361-Amphidinium_carterae.1
METRKPELLRRRWTRKGGPQQRHTAHQEARSEVGPPVQGTGQRDDHRASSPGRGSPLNAEHGNLAELRENDVDLSTMPAVHENDDDDVEDANGDLPSQEPKPGAALGADAMAVEEARKRIHATLDAGEDQLNSQPDSEGHA